MIYAFRNLNEEEVDLMLKAPLLVTILVAGADDDIDKNEKEWAAKLNKYRGVTSRPILRTYYAELGKRDFERELESLISALPSQAKERNPAIAQELEKINDIFPKLDEDFAKEFYQNLVSLATSIASSSGGVFGIHSISREEKKWLDLKMITPPA